MGLGVLQMRFSKLFAGVAGCLMVFKMTLAASAATNLALPEMLALDSYGMDKSASIIIDPASFREPDEGALSYALRRIDTPNLGPYSFNTFLDQSSTVWLDLAGIMAVTTYFGTSSDGYGSVPFHFSNEGFFGPDTYALGMDKLGHAYATYLYTEYLTQRIGHSSDNLDGAALTAAILAFGIQTGVEVYDGYSTDFGFSTEDLVADAVGAGFSVLRSTVPGLAKKLDYRMEYLPSNWNEFSPFNDYNNQKYVLALKLSGFEELENTPLRFVELQAGYFARGATKEERDAGMERRREPYFAIALNLQEIIDGVGLGHSVPGQLAKRSLEYVQLPYTYAATVQK